MKKINTKRVNNNSMFNSIYKGAIIASTIVSVAQFATETIKTIKEKKRERSED